MAGQVRCPACLSFAVFFTPFCSFPCSARNLTVYFTFVFVLQTELVHMLAVCSLVVFCPSDTAFTPHVKANGFLFVSFNIH